MAWTAPRTWVTGEVVTASQMNTHVRDDMLALGRRAMVPPMQRGTADMELWMWAGVVMYSETGPSTTVQVAGIMTAHACFIPRGATVDRLNFEVTTSIAGNARVGLYATKSETNIYPGSLLVDGGEFSTSTTGHKTATVSALANDGLYWAVFLSSAGVTIRTPGRANYMFLGTAIGATPGTNTQGHGLRVSQSYGALPSTFPASASLVTTEAIAGIQIRLA